MSDETRANEGEAMERIKEILREFAECMYGDKSPREQEHEVERAAEALLEAAPRGDEQERCPCGCDAPMDDPVPHDRYCICGEDGHAHACECSGCQRRFSRLMPAPTPKP